MRYPTYSQDPAATLDYTEDWSSWLASGETITTATVSASSGVTVSSFTNTTTSVTAWLTGGVVGQMSTVVFTITTSVGRTDARRIQVTVGDR